MTNRINLLWFDDDLRPRDEGVTSERLRLQTWLRYLNTPDRVERILLIEVRDLASFRRELQARCDKPADDPAHIDAFLIDVLWRTSGDPSDKNFGDLDPAFKDERVLPLDAGAQLVGLMRNRRHEPRRPSWLKAFDQHPMAVLTTLTDHRGTVDRHIDVDVLPQLEILVKNASQESTEPDEAFCRWVNGLSKRTASGTGANAGRGAP